MKRLRTWTQNKVQDLSAWSQEKFSSLSRHWIALLASLLIALLLALISLVLVLGDSDARLGLASELAAGLVVAVVVVLWEKREQAQSQREAIRKRGAILRTLTEHVGVELSPIGAELQLIGVDAQGAPLELFPSIEEAMNAFRSHTGVSKLMREIGKRRSRNKLQPDLLRVLRRAVPGFYSRLEQHMDVFLNYFMTSGDDRTVGALLELWSHRRNISEPPPEQIPHVTEVQEMLRGKETPAIRRQRQYFTGVVRLLLWYSELLRAVDGVQSGIPGRRNRTVS